MFAGEENPNIAFLDVFPVEPDVLGECVLVDGVTQFSRELEEVTLVLVGHRDGVQLVTFKAVCWMLGVESASWVEER